MKYTLENELVTLVETLSNLLNRYVIIIYFKKNGERERELSPFYVLECFWCIVFHYSIKDLRLPHFLLNWANQVKCIDC